jgi:hypothetical protein
LVGAWDADFADDTSSSRERFLGEALRADGHAAVDPIVVRSAAARMIRFYDDARMGRLSPRSGAGTSLEVRQGAEQMVALYDKLRGL